MKEYSLLLNEGEIGLLVGLLAARSEAPDHALFVALWGPLQARLTELANVLLQERAKREKQK